MTLLNNRTAKRIQNRTEAGFYGDTANLLSDVPTTVDAYGHPNAVTVTTTALTCSFTDKPKAEKWAGYADITQIAAEIRFKGSVAPAFGNRIVLTGRFGNSAYVDQTFEIIGIRDRGELGYVCALAKVTI